MSLTLRGLIAGSLGLASLILVAESPAQWGPGWGPGVGPGWGPGVAPGWGPYGPPPTGAGEPPQGPSEVPTETREDYEFVPNPYGPGWTETRRRERRSAWSGPAGTYAPDWGPFGPSPTDIRRYHRQLFYRGLGVPY